CCGLTWVSTGQLTTAKRVLRRTVERLAELLEEGGGGEPEDRGSGGAEVGSEAGPGGRGGRGRLPEGGGGGGQGEGGAGGGGGGWGGGRGGGGGRGRLPDGEVRLVGLEPSCLAV